MNKMVTHLGILYLVCISVVKVFGNDWDMNDPTSGGGGGGDSYGGGYGSAGYPQSSAQNYGGFDPNCEDPGMGGGGYPEATNYGAPQQAPQAAQSYNSPYNSKGGDDCNIQTGKSVTDYPQSTEVRMLSSKKEISTEKPERKNLETTECTEIVYLKPKTSVKIETYTVPYGSKGKFKKMTRKRLYIKRRRKIRHKINKPVLIIRRKHIKMRQTFERIIPKIVETREIVNKPKVKESVETEPMIETFTQHSNQGQGGHEGYGGGGGFGGGFNVQGSFGGGGYAHANYAGNGQQSGQMQGQ